MNEDLGTQKKRTHWGHGIRSEPVLRPFLWPCGDARQFSVCARWVKTR